MKRAIIYDPVEEFRKYVEAEQDKGERHTKAACESFDLFRHYTEDVDTTLPGPNISAIKLQECAMDMAVEYEESGFAAGMRWAFEIMKGAVPGIAAVEK